MNRSLASVAAHYLRTWDAVSSARVDRFAANSQHVSNRIRKYYRRDARVVYPPVSIDQFDVGEHKGGYFLTVSALVPYKRIDLAVRACSRLGLKLIVVGDGSERKRLERIAGKTVEFAGPVPFERIAELYQNATALIHAAEEDFGIAMVEAQACGCPVIAYGRGGALEIVISEGDGNTGVFFKEQNVRSLEEALVGFKPENFDPQTARRNSERFDRVRFLDEMTKFIREAWDDNRSKVSGTQ